MSTYKRFRNPQCSHEECSEMAKYQDESWHLSSGTPRFLCQDHLDMIEAQEEGINLIISDQSLPNLGRPFPGKN